MRMTSVQLSIQALNDPKNLQQVSPNWAGHVPNFSTQITTRAVKGAFFASFSHHLDGKGFDTIDSAMFSSLEVAVPHQGDAVAVNPYNAVYHMAAAFYLS